jgi:hypothetical protein
MHCNSTVITCSFVLFILGRAFLVRQWLFLGVRHAWWCKAQLFLYFARDGLQVDFSRRIDRGRSFHQYGRESEGRTRPRHKSNDCDPSARPSS